MLALAIALLHDPEVLIIDELSLGLAPIVVQELIAVVERLKADGVTMIIVEQSLNVAAAIADRAVFLEKGQVRFEGAIADLHRARRPGQGRLLGRGDLELVLAVGWVNGQIVFDGLVQGLAVAIIATGIVLIYRATRIINFAVGAMGLVGAVTLSLLTIQYHVPFWAAFAPRSGHRTRVRRGHGDRGRSAPAYRPSGGGLGVDHRNRRTGADDCG